MKKRPSQEKDRRASTFSIVQEAESASETRADAVTRIRADNALHEKLAGEVATQDKQSVEPELRRKAGMNRDGEE